MLFVSVPSKVTGVSVSPTVTLNHPTFHVTWSIPSSDGPIQHYQVDYRVVTTGSWNRWSPNPTSTLVTLRSLFGLQRGTSYRVRVRAVSDIGSGIYSNIIGGTTYDSKFFSYIITVEGFIYMCIQHARNIH